MKQSLCQKSIDLISDIKITFDRDNPPSIDKRWIHQSLCSLIITELIKHGDSLSSEKYDIFEIVEVFISIDRFNRENSMNYPINGLYDSYRMVCEIYKSRRLI